MANVGRKKIEKSEVEKRVRNVQEWILRGYPTSDIIKQLSKNYKITERQSYRYYKKAFELFKKENEREIEEKKAFHLEIRRKLYKDLSKKDSATGASVALRIIDSMARIEGLGFPPQHKEEKQIEEEKVATMKLPDGTEIEI